MQAEEIVRRLEAAGFLPFRHEGSYQRGTVTVRITPPNEAGSQACAVFCTFEDLANMLTTDEERLATKALRDNVELKYQYPIDTHGLLSGHRYKAVTPNVAVIFDVPLGLTQLAIWAAAARALGLEEGEKHG